MDPLATTFGRDRGEFALLRWLPQLHQQQKETAAALSLLFAVLASCLFLYVMDSSDAVHDTYWAELPWVQTTCSVQDVGMAYRGNCRLDTTLNSAPHGHFAECRGPPDSRGNARAREAVRREYLRTSAGQCAEMGDRDYESVQANRPRPLAGAAAGTGFGGADLASEQAAAQSAADLQDAAMSRRLSMLPQSLRHCHSGYLAWAAVAVVNASAGRARSTARCAYQFGAATPSISGLWDDANGHVDQLRQRQLQQEPMPCWTLPDDDCVVAFGPPADLARNVQAGGALASHLCGIFGALALAGAVLAGYWHWRDHGCWGVLPPGGYEGSLPAEDPYLSDGGGLLAPALSDRVLGIVRAAAARFGEVTPVDSAPQSLRASKEVGSRRTVAVAAGAGAVGPRNLATEFLEPE